MSEIILSNQSLSANHFKQQTGEEISNLSCLASSDPKSIQAYTPYAASSEIDRSALAALSDPNLCRTVTDLSLCYGSDNVMALADVMSNSVGLTGAATSVYGSRIGEFGKAIQKYQDLLMEYQKIYKSKSATPAAKTLAKTKASTAFQQLQLKFGYELQFSTKRLKSKQLKKSPLMNADRGTNIARSSRNTTKLNLTNSVHTKSLMTLAKQTKYLGNGLAVIDFGSRVGNIQNEYKANGNWEREMFIESLSFTTSAVVGSVAVSAGTTALGILVVATPIGWVGLIIAGAAIATTAAVASYQTNKIIKSKSGDWYDSIISAVGTL